MADATPTRRRLLSRWVPLPFLLALEGCGAAMPARRATDATGEARALLAESAAAHGIDALAAITDLSVAYQGAFHPLVGRLQPALVDAGFRGASEERLLLRDGIVAQAHAGPAGRKQVVRRTEVGAKGTARVWFNGDEAMDGERRDAAALVADGYSLFLLGPMLLVQGPVAAHVRAMELAGTERLVLDEAEYECDVLRIGLAPGIGLSEGDEVALLIDRRAHLMRRVRFTLDGLDPTRGAVAEVDASGHVLLHGVRWPTRFHEHLLRPLPLPVHDWRLTGLDVNRGLGASDVSGPAFTGRAAAPAGMLP
jgi:hypothetical protein